MMLRRLAVVLSATLLAFAAPPPGARPQHGPVLAIDGDRFTVDGAARFLIFISYFDGLRASPSARDRDLTWLRGSVSGVRVFANWHHWCSGAPVDDGVIGPRGVVNRERLDALRTFLSAAAARGMLVDLSFDHGIGTDSITIDAYKAAVAQIANEVRDFRNVLFDIENEYQLHSFSDGDVAAVLHAARQRDSSRLLAASRVGDAVAAGAAARATGMDFVAFHDPRAKGSWFTAPRIRGHVLDVRSGLKPLVKPIYFQEPESFDPGPCQPKSFDPDPDHARQAADAARAAGAAAWTFHTRAGFDLSRSSMSEQLTAAERTAIQGLARR